MRFKLEDIFGFADQEKVTCGLGYNITLKRNNNNDPNVRTAEVDAAKTVVIDIGWYIPHITVSLKNHEIVMDQILNEDPTELYYMERIVFRKNKTLIIIGF